MAEALLWLTTRAALLLGVAMRLAPDFAEDVLRAVAGLDDQPLHWVLAPDG